MSKLKWKAGTMIYPLPAVMVSCGDMNNSNIITVAWTGTICTNPAMTYISIRPERYSYELIKKSGEIVDYFGVGYEPIESLIEMISLFFEERQDLYDKIASTVIPVIVYTGDESNLPDIFDRINSKGTPLDQYEVYAAAWPVNEKYVISNTEIIEYIVRKYDSFVEDGFQIHG